MASLVKIPLYVADTVALARYLEDNLPREADGAFRRAEMGKATILVPTIAVAEFIYIGLKGRLKAQDPKAAILELLGELESSPYLRQADVAPKAWEIFLNSNVPELHDRMIFSIASFNGAEGIITNDSELKASGFPIIW